MKKIMTAVTDYSIIVLGAIVYAVSVVIFTAPNNIAPGGLTGIGTVLNYLYDLPIGVIIFVFNIPLFVWGAIENGIKFLTKTIVGTASISVAIDVMGLFLTNYTGDLMLASIFGGILNGLGLGIIFYSGGSTGGTDIVSLNIHKHYPHLSTGSIILAIDAVIIIFAAIIYKSLESALYAVIAIFVSIKVIDAINYGFSRDNGKAMFIVTNKYKEITDELFMSVKRGVTLLEAQGGYKMDDKKVIMCALRPQQVHKVIKIIKSVDENAFTIVTTAGAISGNGFRKK
ncbi:MAG: YitT family protein [Ruminococcus sp.]|nr:YitT family protein [Ruminococcus sp.]